MDEDLTKKAFEKLVSDAIDNIPEAYQDKIKDVVFKVEYKPSDSQRESLGLNPYAQLYGLYEGVPLTKRNGAVHSKVPDVITIFMYPMIIQFKDEKKLRKQIYETVWHEVAHYFGLDHDRIYRAKGNIEQGD